MRTHQQTGPSGHGRTPGGKTKSCQIAQDSESQMEHVRSHPEQLHLQRSSRNTLKFGRQPDASQVLIYHQYALASPLPAFLALLVLMMSPPQLQGLTTSCGKPPLLTRVGHQHKVRQAPAQGFGWTTNCLLLEHNALRFTPLLSNFHLNHDNHFASLTTLAWSTTCVSFGLDAVFPSSFFAQLCGSQRVFMSRMSGGLTRVDAYRHRPS